MQEVTVTYNHCGKVVGNNGYNSLRIQAELRPYNIKSYENGYLDVDLCPECTRKMFEFMNEDSDYFERTR